ncbi:MarR family winged helix-turn-helix transcriptional regulator [Psychrobacter sp. I-STPA10]|uniref:MarR family winged helix-turn-helix transcriptional regulator n=1 Tax=Psychrobacter sp. I-STPA10 TaxID=2585769 RepID=UPI001E4031F4|nr:MarR family winged helix-turn-helix transcriptional regulator [Psychrobacter sp. I-STPA10]
MTHNKPSNKTSNKAHSKNKPDDKSDGKSDEQADDSRTTEGSALSNLMLDLFKLNSRVLTAGDRLVADLGMTSSRWQVLGTIMASEQPQPVSWLARDMGVSRQNVQRIVNDLAKEDLVAFEPNPHHQRAHLVVLTAKGQQIFHEADQRQTPWVNALAEGIALEDIQAMHRVIMTLAEKLEE